jgi:heavy metal sensor kinase
LAGVQAFLRQSASADNPVNLSREFEQRSGLRLNGDPFQVMDSGGQWIYRPPSMLALQLPATRPQTGAVRSSATVQRNGGQYRILTATITAGNQLYLVQLASNITPSYQIVDRFASIAAATIPFILMLSGIGGYWLSGRAMQPVYAITDAANRISERNLSQRLNVPNPKDELRQLSETLNQMFARLERAFQRITQFTADASHELRTPVAMIRTTAEHILQRERTIPEYQQMVGQILLESERMTEIINQLLVLARADEVGAKRSRETTDLRNVLEEVAARFRPIAERKKLRFGISLEGRPLEIVCDARDVQSLFTILLDNATKYTRPGGSISVESGSDGRRCWVTIQDSGIGISDQDLRFIFDRFYRADKARGAGDGIGLGLSIAKSIADAHEGEIEVSSKLGCGSVFRVVLPMNTRTARS